MPDIRQSNIQKAFLRHRDALISYDAKNLGEIMQLYAQVWQSVEKELSILTIQIQSARDKGEQPSWNSLVRLGRLKRIEQVVASHTAAFANAVDDLVTGAQQSAIDRGIKSADELIQLAIDGWNKADKAVGDGKQAYRIPSKFNEPHMEALNAMVGYTADGSPLADVLLKHAGAAQSSVRLVLAKGIAEGWSPYKTARQMRDAMDAEQMYPAMRIARTETLRAYNTASLESYKANDDVVAGWQWTAKIDDHGSPPCAACFALHGKVFKLDDTHQAPPAHPQCRCVPISLIAWPGENMQETRKIAEERGVSAAAREFDAYSTEEKAVVLGGMKAAKALESGEVKLRDFVDSRVSDDWGKTYGVNSLKRAQVMANMRGSSKNAKTMTAERGDRFMELVSGNASEDEIKAAIQANEINLRLSSQKMKRHMEGNKGYDEYVAYNAKHKVPTPSVISDQFTLDDIQSLVVRYAGKGALRMADDGSWKTKEFIPDVGATIGYTWDSRLKKMMPTRSMIIEYGKTSVHCYPAMEKKI